MMKWFLSMLVVTSVLAGTVAAAEQERQRGDRGERAAGARDGQRGGIQRMLTAAGIKVTEAQQEELDAIAEETATVMAGIRDAEDRRAALEGVRETLNELREKAMAVLTEEQRKALEAYREEQRAQGKDRPQAKRRVPGT